MGMTECGLNSLVLNSYINTSIEIKKLTFHTPDKNGVSKCHYMHIGNKKENCAKLHVHGYEMDEVDKLVYLGDIISNDGKNLHNIKNRVNKSIGIISQIFTILKELRNGHHFFETALLLRESMLLAGILTNCESWHNVTKEDLYELEKIDRNYLRGILKTQISTPSESLYLELGIIPIKYIIIGRRLNFLHYLCNREKSSMLYKFFLVQWIKPEPGDWSAYVKKDMEELELDLDIEEISRLSKNNFKNIVKKKIRKVAFKKLMDKKHQHKKMKNLHYNDLKIQTYLKNPEINKFEASNIFKFRTHMVEEFRENFKGNSKEIHCDECKSHRDNQDEILNCTDLTNKFVRLHKVLGAYSTDVPVEVLKIITKIIN